MSESTETAYHEAGHTIALWRTSASRPRSHPGGRTHTASFDFTACALPAQTEPQRIDGSRQAAGTRHAARRRHVDRGLLQPQLLKAPRTLLHHGVGSAGCPRRVSCSMREQAAVDRQDLARDAVRAAERDDLVGDVLRPGGPPQERAPLFHLPHRRRHSLRPARPFDQAGSHAVDQHIGGQRHGQAARQVDQGRLARGVR